MVDVFAASSSNTYTKTFTGIDGAGKRLADEVSFEIDEPMCKIFKLLLYSMVPVALLGSII